MNASVDMGSSHFALWGSNIESHPWEQIYPPGSALEVASYESEEGVAPAGDHWLAPPDPNPARGDVGVRFKTASRERVRLAVYDAAGRLLKARINGIVDPGEYHPRIDLSSAAPGIYFCDLRTPEGTFRKAFVVMK